MWVYSTVSFARNNKKFLYKLAFGSHFEYVTGVPTRGERHERRMADNVQPYQFELVMTAEELSAYRKRVSNRRDEDSDGEDEEENDRDSRIGNSSCCSCGR